MKRYIIYIGLLISILTACADDALVKSEGVSGKEVWATLSFGHQSFEKIDISTRATMSEVAESRVENLYVYVFDGNGKRLYSHYYDNNNRKETLPTDVGNYWTVRNRTTANQNNTQGEIRLKAPVMTGGSIYVIANLNADQLNISADQLNTIDTLEELEALTITLNQEITSRTGYFLMTGSESGINVSSDGRITKNNSGVKISLQRLDAKVTVNVQIGQSGIANQEMRDFVPESWQVMRLPKGTKLLAANDDADNLGYFDSPVNHFESDMDGIKSFSFYQLENMENTTGLTSYNQRDLRKKKDNGTYDTSSGLWKHASEDATYMIIKGKVQMKVNTNVVTDMQYLEADVVYYIHLGNFGNSNQGGSYNDFTIRRNTHYTYNITIKGVNSIEVEVESSQSGQTFNEPQSGATGHVYKSKEEVYTFDAHYGQKVFRIDASVVDPEKVTWYVKTPFGREGTPDVESGTQIPDLDYKWVKFLLNKKEYNGVYSNKNRWYPGDEGQALEEGEELMDVVRFTEFIKEEKMKLDAAYEDIKPTASAFRKDNSGVYCMYVTAFVDEYYYEVDPLNSNNKPQDLWKLFVNQPNRIMHILSDTKKSNDGASSLTSSILTIRQRSIQTPYNIEKPLLTTAWGCESEDEFENSQLFFYSHSESMTSVAGGSLNNMGDSSTLNGLYNSVKIWGIVPGSSRWDAYLDYERVNDYEARINNISKKTYFMKDNYAVLRYATLMRNRDNDGDGVIDAEELRWYVSSLNQLYDLYMGQLGLDSDVALYTSAMAARSNYVSGPYTGAHGWRNHVISSTWEGSQPSVLWAEEGISRSPYATRYSKPAPYSIRCVRNLGLVEPAVTEEGEEKVGYPERLIKVEEPTDTHGYRFDLSNVNTKSLRYYTSRELEPGNENEETARVYYGFETGEVVTYPSVNNTDDYNNKKNYAALKQALEAGTNISDKLKDGYRVPNVREGALMSLYCSQNWWNTSGGYVMVNTWYSNGDLGTQKDGGHTSWQFGYRFATIGQGGVNKIRAVRDWNPTTNQ